MRRLPGAALAAVLFLCVVAPARADSPWSKPVGYAWLGGYAHPYSHGNGMLMAAWQSFDGDPHVFASVRPPNQDFAPLESFSLGGGTMGFRAAFGGDGSRYFTFRADRHYVVIGRAGQPLAEPKAVTSSEDAPAGVVPVADQAGDAALLWYGNDNVLRFSWQPAGGDFGPAEALPSVGVPVAAVVDTTGETFVLADPVDHHTLNLLVRRHDGNWSDPIAMPAPPGPQQFAQVQMRLAGVGSVVIAWERIDSTVGSKESTIWATRFRNGGFGQPQELALPVGHKDLGASLKLVAGPDGQAAVLADYGGEEDSWRALWLAGPDDMFAAPQDPPNGTDRQYDAYGHSLGDSGFDALGNLVTTWRGPAGTKAAVKLKGSAVYCPTEVLQPDLGQRNVGPWLALFDDGTGTVLSEGQSSAYKALDHCTSSDPRRPATPLAPAIELAAGRVRVGKVGRVSSTLRTATLDVVCDGPGRCSGSIALRRRARSPAVRVATRFVAGARTKHRVRVHLPSSLRRELRSHRRVRATAAIVVNGRSASERRVELVRR